MILATTKYEYTSNSVLEYVWKDSDNFETSPTNGLDESNAIREVISSLPFQNKGAAARGSAPPSFCLFISCLVLLLE
jgi:hypothetical protein